MAIGGSQNSAAGGTHRPLQTTSVFPFKPSISSTVSNRHHLLQAIVFASPVSY